jgi:predicted PurR-regulated permease PerM
MNNYWRYISLGVILLVILFIAYQFSSIIIYIIISAILSLIGRPLMDWLCKIRIRKYHIPRALNAAVTVIAIWALLIAFFLIFIPILLEEAKGISQLDVNSILSGLSEPLTKLEKFLSKYFIIKNENVTFDQYITQKVLSFLTIADISTLFGKIVSIFGNLFIAAFSITFITFFFLKEEGLFAEILLLFIPEKYEDNMRKAMLSIKKLLVRYFIGISIEITCIILLVITGQTIVGVGFSHAVVIGFFAGIINIVPYLGPIIGSTLGLLIGLVNHLEMDFYTQLFPMLIFMTVVFLIVHAIDNFVFQPLIYSSSVKAHPLEIFLVILAASTIGGILGMIVAIPLYTIIRVIAKEFFNEYKVVKKLTRKI